MTMPNSAPTATTAASGGAVPAAISAGTVPAAQASAALAAIGRAREKSRTAEVRLIGADAPAAADAVTGADTAVSFPLDQFAKQNGADAAVQTAGGVVNVHAVFQMDAQTRELTVAIVSEDGQLIRMIPAESVSRMIAAMADYRGR